MRRQLPTAIVVFALLTLLTGVVYPLCVTGIAQVAFGHRANGSLVTRDGVAVGSSLIAQAFTTPGYFHPRPSSAGGGYDAMASGASNLGPSNPALREEIERRDAAYRRLNGLSAAERVPDDAVTGSGSGLDPHISVANARLQARRVATARHLPLPTVLKLVDGATARRPLKILGEPGVNVLTLNLSLDQLAPRGTQ